MKTILVTGIAGLIGSRFSSWLVHQFHGSIWRQEPSAV